MLLSAAFFRKKLKKVSEKEKNFPENILLIR